MHMHDDDIHIHIQIQIQIQIQIRIIGHQNLSLCILVGPVPEGHFVQLKLPALE